MITASLSLLSSPAYATDNITVNTYYPEEIILGEQPLMPTHFEVPGFFQFDDKTKVTYILLAIIVPMLTMTAGFKLFIFGRLFRSKDGTQENQYRSEIYRHIQENPGLNKAQMSSRLNINMGTLRYHLDSLKSKKLITEMADGKYTRFFGSRVCIENSEKRIISALRNTNKRKIIEEVMQSPGLNVSGISLRTGIGYSTTSECLKQMLDDNMVMRKKDAQHNGYYLNPDMIDIVIKALDY